MGALYLQARATGEKRELLELRHYSTLCNRVRQTGQTLLGLNPPSEALTCLRQTQEILKFVPDWLERGIIREVTEPALLYFSKMFTVAKKNGKRCPILDLSRLIRCYITAITVISL